MNKRKLHHSLRLLHWINSYVLISLCIICAVTAVVALRSNNQHMIKLRDAVFTADRSGGDIEGALTNLRKYVYAHMNTNLSSGANAVKPPIQLKYEYDRLTAAAKAKYDSDNAQVVADATATCTAQVGGAAVSLARYACAKAYAEAHPVTLQTVSEDLYKFDFVSPFWSPDLAGWSMVAGGFFLLLLVIRTISTWAIKEELKSSS